MLTFDYIVLRTYYYEALLCKRH